MFIPLLGYTQVTISPQFATADQQITITYDATQGSSNLQGVSRVKAHMGVILTGPAGTSWEHVIGAWGDPNSPGEMTSLGNNKWSITITPRSYFAPAGLPVSATVYRLGMVFREAGPCGGFSGVGAVCKKGAATGGGDIYVDLTQGGFELSLISPSVFPIFKNAGEQVNIVANTSETANFTVTVNGTPVHTANTTTHLEYNHPVTETGLVNVVISATNGVSTKQEEFDYFVRLATSSQARPTGIIDGINYHTDQTKATLGLWAPGKNSVYVVGDFNNWKLNSAYQMKKDGEHFWLEINGLTPGQEYAFRYLVDETIMIADPYADKILDPDDQYIPESIYPNLKDFPTAAFANEGYFNRLAVLQTNQQAYPWQVTSFQKPDKDKLVIYELLIRDFFNANNRSYQNLIDTIGYFKSLGVNAIQLMPIMEFNGNESWGYNPTFMFAPDKAYGTKNDLKEFVDVCHQNGIAVILDIAMNHQDTPNPYAMLDFDFTQNVFRPTVNNKWFNVSDRHPYGVFFDLNHESSYTKAYLDTVNHYWLNEYKIDGFRFDLSKGFTQNTKCSGSTSDEGCFQQYDASRIAILKRMADVIWSHTDDAIIILEHFAENSEEKELAEYKLNEGKGMMLWGNTTGGFAQNTMGFSQSSDFSWSYYGNRNWAAGHLVSYMESHDEERMMYRNVTFGNSSGTYNVRNVQTALNRTKAISTMFYATPGAKMLWQFGELGYDKSINTCSDGTVNPPGPEGGEGDCRLANKPLVWQYQQDQNRKGLYNHISDLLRLRNTYDVFTDGTAVIFGGLSLQKHMVLRNSPYVANPQNTGEMNVVIAVNFDVTTKTSTVNFPHAGTWYEYYGGADLTVSAATASIQLNAGEFRLYTDVEIDNPSIITGYEPEVLIQVSLYPNPTGNVLKIDSEEVIQGVTLITMQGSVVSPKRISADSWDVSSLAGGLYIAEVKTIRGSVKIKVIKQNN